MREGARAREKEREMERGGGRGERQADRRTGRKRTRWLGGRYERGGPCAGTPAGIIGSSGGGGPPSAAAASRRAAFAASFDASDIKSPALRARPLSLPQPPPSNLLRPPVRTPTAPIRTLHATTGAAHPVGRGGAVAEGGKQLLCSSCSAASPPLQRDPPYW